MIDAITEGQEFKHEWLESNEFDPLSIRTIPSALQFTSEGSSFVFECNDPRVAREIAGALVAWANRKEGKTDEPNPIADAIWVESLRANRNVQKSLTEVTAPSISDWANIKSGRSTREEWYRRNVRHMTPETLKRNMKDLKEIKAQTPVGPEYDDIQKAIDILHVALNGGNIPPLPEGNDNV